MPTYEYKCDACGLEFERFQQITAKPVKICPRCGKKKVRRLISAGAGMIFKGSGFYITDYRDQGYKDKAKADTASATETKSEGKSDSKSESKTETKAESKSDSTSTKSETTAKPTPPPAKPEPKASKSAKKK